MGNATVFADLEHDRQTGKNQVNLPQPKVIYRATFKTFARVKEDLSEERRPHPIAGLC